jgi:signal transduction histidine kinase
MPKAVLSMRWWLGLVFATIAALTALSVAEVFNHRADVALRDRGQALAAGQSVAAAQSISLAVRRGDMTTVAPVIAERHRLSVWVFSPSGMLLSSQTSRGIAFQAVPSGEKALRTALKGGRFVYSYEGGKAFVVGLHLRALGGGAVVTYTPRPDLRQELGIVQSEVIKSALIAVGLGAVVGLLVATLIAARLGRIAKGAAVIAAGGFDSPLRVRFGDEVGSLGATIDRMRERLRDSFQSVEAERDRLHRLLDTLEEGVIAIDEDLVVAYANEPARELFAAVGLEEGSALGEPWPGFSLETFARGLFEPNSGGVLHARVVSADRIYALAGIAASSGSQDATLVVADVSDRERRERAERDFVTNAAHELGTPVAAITAALEALETGAKAIPEQRDRFLELIERQTSRLVRLRRALLILARAQTGQEAIGLQSIELLPVLERVVSAAREAGPASVALGVDCPAGLCALGREELLEQIVFSLVENALRHSGATFVELVAKSDETHFVELEIRDDGRGIPSETRDRVFDRFYQADDHGTGFGLGLAIVREAVRALGGTVRIDPGTGPGTTVRVQLIAGEELASG